MGGPVNMEQTTACNFQNTKSDTTSMWCSLDHLLLEPSQHFMKDHKCIWQGHMEVFQPTVLNEVPALASRHVSKEAFEMTPASATVWLQFHEKPQAQWTQGNMTHHDKNDYYFGKLLNFEVVCYMAVTGEQDKHACITQVSWDKHLYHTARKMNQNSNTFL